MLLFMIGAFPNESCLKIHNIHILTYIYTYVYNVERERAKYSHLF